MNSLKIFLCLPYARYPVACRPDPFRTGIVSGQGQINIVELHKKTFKVEQPCFDIDIRVKELLPGDAKFCRSARHHLHDPNGTFGADSPAVEF